ncbi:hypothetical protein, partial [Pseudomonas putida]|uniref:hypothetical protein n=1 Tax=Pseudomonas putida TaxID=303 RepID=UPI003905880A
PQGGPDQEAPQRAGVRYLVAEPGRFEHEGLLLFARYGTTCDPVESIHDHGHLPEMHGERFNPIAV